jgi:branched-chain amino acid transport system substrate-binding protein
MSRKAFTFMSLMLALALILAACAPAATTEPAATQAQAQPTSAAATSAPATSAPATQPPATSEEPQATEKTLTIGFTSSQTGSLNVESLRQQKGLQLWMDQVNAAGGIKLADGTVLKFAAKSYDDESKKDRVQELYTKLATEDKADFLISPYSSGLADAAAVIAEQYGKVMITTGAASDSTYMKGYTLVYQTYTPASRYLTGAADLLAKLDGSAKKIAIVHENDKFSTDVANALNDYAQKNGFEIVMLEGYDTGTTDFAPFINKIVAQSPDAIMGGGHFPDTSTFAKQLYEKAVTAKFISLLVAPPEPKFAELGDAALGIIGPSQWEPSAKYSEEAAKAAGLEWYGTSVADFTSAYQAAFNEEPSYHSAGGYAAGLLLQKAIETAGSTENDKIKAAMDGLDLLTFFGHLKFDTSAERHGLQIGHDMVYIQWQKQGDKLAKVVVWPEAGKSADALYPAR